MDLAIVNGDIKIENGVPETDDGFESAVYLSLFTDRRDENSEEKRGWWADALEDYQLGSRLWTLARESITAETLRLAKDYVTESLEWLIIDGIADSVDVDISRKGLYYVLIAISIIRPDKTKTGYAYNYNWESQEANPVHAR